MQIKSKFSNHASTEEVGETFLMTCRPFFCLVCRPKGGFPFREKCRAIDFLRLLSFEMCSLISFI